MAKKRTFRQPATGVIRVSIAAVMLVVLLLGAMATGPAAQEDLSDETLYSQLEVVVREQTVTATGIDTVKEIPVMQDTYIASNKPDQNFGGDSSLREGYDTSGYGAVRSFVQFDVAGNIPSQAVINRATIEFYQYAYSPPGDSPMTMAGRHLISSWNEYLVTWNSHQPDWGGIVGYADFPATLGWIQHDVTELVREWHNNTHSNFGLIIIGDEHVQERQRHFYSLNANNGRYPRLVVDYTESTDTVPPVGTVSQLPVWSQSSFTVSWSGYDPGGSGIAYFDIQYNINNGIWQDWQMHTTAPSAQFVGGQNNADYYFRARAVDFSGNVQQWGPAQAQTRVDAVAPQATVNPLPTWTLEQSFVVSWTGWDSSGGSGVASYDVQVRYNSGPWVDWFVNTQQTSIQVTGAQDGLYELRARATDVAGNVQAFSQDPQAWTIVDTSGPLSFANQFRPPKTSADSFVVSWTATPLPAGLTIQYFDVRYQFQGGPWVLWQSKTTLTSATFSSLEAVDGAYSFEVRAMDSAGRLEDWTGVPEAAIYVDKEDPLLTPQSNLPVVFNDDHP